MYLGCIHFTFGSNSELNSSSTLEPLSNQYNIVAVLADLVVVPPEDEGGRLGAVGDDARQVHGAALLQVDVGAAHDRSLGL